MKKIEAEDTVEVFMEKMKKGLSKGRLAGVVSFQRENDLLIVIFEKFGTSRIYFKLQIKTIGFIAVYEKENISFAHGIFKKEVETKLVTMMRRFGAIVED
ncbi:MAG: hypothetical protein SFU98_10085 [Leptospiraceae bacterium]|nr:hypothetical protein [Leptospiraceae bacterium]